MYENTICHSCTFACLLLISIYKLQAKNAATASNTVRISSMEIHVLDVNPPRPAFAETFKHVHFHRGSITDKVNASHESILILM